MMAAVWLSAFALYVMTAAPTVTVGDSGELIAAAYTVGVAHPPGYPLYVVIAKMVSVLAPMGNIAFRVNVCSALGMATACALMAGWFMQVLESRKSIIKWSAASLGVAVMAVAPTVWQHGVIAEVYALNLCVLTGTLWMLWKGQRDWSWNYAAWCGVGVSLMHHQSMGLLVPVFLAAGWKSWMRPGWKLGAGGGLLLAGLMGMVFLVLPIRSLANPGLDWGNPEIIGNLFHTVLREQYRVTTGEVRTAALWLGQLKVWADWHIAGWGVPLLIFSALGYVYYIFRISDFGFKKLVGNVDPEPRTPYSVPRTWFWIMLLIWASMGIGVCAVGNFKLEAFDREVIEVFWMPCALAVAWGAAWGVVACWERRWTVVVVGAAAAVMWQGYASAASIGPLRQPLGYWHGKNILQAPEENSWLFVAAEDNDIFPAAYGVLVEGYGKSQRILDDLGCVITGAYGDDFKWLAKPQQFLRMKDIQDRVLEGEPDPKYFTLAAHLWNVVLESPTKGCVPTGLLYRVVSQEKGWKGEAVVEGEMAQRLRETRRFATVAWKRYPTMTTELVGKMAGWDVFSRTVIARYDYMRAEHELAAGRLEEALRWGEKTRMLGNDVSWMQNSLGNVFARYGLREFAKAAYVRVMELEPQRPEPLLNLGGLLLNENRLDEAISLFTEAIKRNEAFTPAYINLGSAYSRKGDVETAKKVWRRGLELDPNNVPLRLNLERAQ